MGWGLSGKDVLLKPGTKVRFDGGENPVECGVVVHCWFEEEIGGYDCYVAFFGTRFPNDKPDEVYVLRYAAKSLEVIEYP